MPDLALDIRDAPPGVALVPGPVELFGRSPKLHDKVVGQVLWRGLPTLLVPEANQGRFVVAHDDPGVRAADEKAAILGGIVPPYLISVFHLHSKWPLLTHANWGHGT
jgi:hypothetical protein